eukprot:g43957.t1
MKNEGRKISAEKRKKWSEANKDMVTIRRMPCSTISVLLAAPSKYLSETRTTQELCSHVQDRSGKRVRNSSFESSGASLRLILHNPDIADFGCERATPGQQEIRWRGTTLRTVYPGFDKLLSVE